MGKESGGKMRRKIGVAAAWILFLGMLAAGYFAVGGRLPGGNIFRGAENSIVRVSFLQTMEDADCIVISSGSHGVVIDTGEEQDGTAITEAIRERGIETIDYLILTHPDADHVGGAIELLGQFAVNNVIEPVYDGDKEERMEQINDFCEEKGIPVYYAVHNKKINTDYVKLIVYPPLEGHYKDSNNYSLAVLAKHGQNNMLFTGDALRKRTQELLNMNLPKVELYKVPHHGRANSATEDILREVEPRYAVVTAGTADREVTKTCEEMGTEVLYTAERSVDFISDGKSLYKE